MEEKTDTFKDKIFQKKKPEGKITATGITLVFNKIKKLEQMINVMQSDIKIIKSRLGL
tara:strand:- start:222 stop:395 length:174 start_codon:yes stop_codon:yes gene_type:complete